ncbi:hypothetical protein [Cellulosilyticum sp. I15G10I2]|uniref:hypothetical protein n=1 Tax=Cellulosilyticum sp. I15G10I2 TaxID=1892843 RepID=UPI00085BD2F7|nr:hypothetical protein [Cellulosilyticum sp. I15G10I2]
MSEQTKQFINAVCQLSGIKEVDYTNKEILDLAIDHIVFGLELITDEDDMDNIVDQEQFDRFNYMITEIHNAYYGVA